LDGKVVLVTAASRGIGAAVAQCCRDSGAVVAVNARQESSLRAAPGAVHTFAADLEDATAVAALVPAVVERFGRLDGLVVNTAGPPLLKILDAQMEQWQGAYARLLRPAILLGTAGAKAMLETGDGGSIVFLTSTWAQQPAPGGALSAVMRAGVSALAKQLALELAEHHIRVNSVMPGATATDRMTDILKSKAASNGTTIEVESAKALDTIPLRIWGQAEDIARTVTFLLSPLSRFTTGVAMPVDGGAIRSIF
jgi:3-oxoacyl-[acyl-carrier protein] reductase